MSNFSVLPLLVLIAAIFPYLGSLTVAHADESFSSPHVTARLVSNKDHFLPGESLVVGVEYAIQPGFHIYYKEPGDTGLPTTVRLRIPGIVREAFTEQDFVWPEPKEFKYDDLGVAQGYSKDLSLALPVSVPKEVTQSQLRAEASLSWLECSDSVCIPRKGKVALKLPKGAGKPTKEAPVLNQLISGQVR